MEKFAERQEWLKDARETRRLSRDKLGSFFYDLAKIVFTTLVVGGLFALVTEPQKPGYVVLLIIGVFITCALAFIGYKIINIKIWNI